MKKTTKRKSITAPAQEGPDIVAMITMMQEELSRLGKKIDTLVGQLQPRTQPVQRFDPFQNQRQVQAGQDNNQRERLMYKAICADCRKECEVPFKPSQDRPVYCKECFAKRKQGGPAKDRFDVKPRAIPVPQPVVNKEPVHAAKKPAAKKKAAAKKRKK